MDRRHPENKNRLSYWFPKLPSHIRVPDTVIIPYTGEDLINLLDGKIPEGFDSLLADITKAGNDFGWPMFLRTDYLSGKQSWKNTCYVPTAHDVEDHIINLVEESAMADVVGFPTDCWIARKCISTRPAFHAFRGDMPIVKERRYFTQDAKVVCHHPYWPAEAFYNTNTSTQTWFDSLFYMNIEPDYEVNLLSKLSSEIGATLGGSWSIDWLWSEEKCEWYLVDMAEADQSYHWLGCSIQEET